MRKEKWVLERLVMPGENVNIVRCIVSGPEEDHFSWVNCTEVLSVDNSC